MMILLVQLYQTRIGSLIISYDNIGYAYLDLVWLWTTDQTQTKKPLANEGLFL